MTTRSRSGLALLAVVLTAAVGVTCGEPTAIRTTIVGSWVATSLTAPSEPQWGDGVADDGLSVRMTFDDSGGYTFNVSDDDPADAWMCPGTATCSYSGTYSTSGTTLVLDEETADETSATYTLSGNTLTLAFAATATDPNPYTYVLRGT